MPKPKPGEKEKKFMRRCVTELIEVEGRPDKQAVAICARYWQDYKKKKQ